MVGHKPPVLPHLRSPGRGHAQLRGIRAPAGIASMDSSPGVFDVDAASNYLIQNACRTSSMHACAAFIHQACVAGGIDMKGNPVDARDYKEFLQEKGFNQIDSGFGNTLPAGYKPIPGDMAVYARNHIAMFCNDGMWHSDFCQTGMSPGGKFSEPGSAFTIYRHPNPIGSSPAVKQVAGMRLEMGGLY